MTKENWQISLLAAQGDLSDTFARLDRCGADADLVALAKHCLAATPEGRSQDAGAVAAAAHQAGVEERLRQAELEQVRLGEKRKRRRLVLALAAAALGLVLLGLGGGGAVCPRRERQEKSDARGQATNALPIGNGPKRRANPPRGP